MSRLVGWLVREVVEEVVDVGGDGKKPGRFVLFLAGMWCFLVGWLVVCMFNVMWMNDAKFWWSSRCDASNRALRCVFWFSDGRPSLRGAFLWEFFLGRDAGWLRGGDWNLETKLFPSRYCCSRRMLAFPITDFIFVVRKCQSSDWIMQIFGCVSWNILRWNLLLSQLH